MNGGLGRGGSRARNGSGRSGTPYPAWERVAELAAFAALAWYAAAHWADGLVADAPGGRVLACVAIALAAGAALTLTTGMRSRPARIALRTACTLAAATAGCVTIGLDRHLLAPAHWDELAAGIDRGLVAAGAVSWPYAGPEPWARLVLLLAIPLVLAAAAAAAFWPNRRLRPLALVLLVALYGIAVTEHRFPGELARGAALLLLLAAWLWLPRMRRQGWGAAAVASAAVALACLAALPAAARYDERRPWVDYASWNPFSAQATTRFDWSHSYGPIDWPRDGTTLMTVRSERRHYWRVETLDRFDGLGWVRTSTGGGQDPLLPQPYRPEWESRFRVTIDDLDTDLLPAAGTALEVRGAKRVAATADGTLEAAAGSLERGDSYEVLAFVPEPTPEQMRGALLVPGTRDPYVPAELRGYTSVYLPPPGTTALDATAPERPAAGDGSPTTGADGSPAGAPGHPATAAEILASPYVRVLRLARRLARGRATPYDAVRAVQRHLRSAYTYSERPPTRAFPLAAFLFQDRIGYCQQFSGAMALMLRMLGIPARVAAGFAPGSYNRDTKEYRVRDLDAHSWVEVWFTGIGWVPFDPTPSIAPAELQSAAEAASAAGGAGAAGETPDRRGQGGGALSERAGDALGGGGEGDPAGAAWTVAAGLGLAVLAALALAGVRARRRARARERTAGREPELDELERALALLDAPLPRRVTLRQLESRLARTAGPAAAHYVRLLRERRYAPRGGRTPGRRERRGLRRALARGRGPAGRLRALAALPPAPFRRG